MAVIKPQHTVSGDVEVLLGIGSGSGSVNVDEEKIGGCRAELLPTKGGFYRVLCMMGGLLL